MVNVFRVWRNKEALKMKCNKRSRNICYTIFRDSNFKKIKWISCTAIQYFPVLLWFSRLKMFFSVFGPLFFTFLADLSKWNVALFWEWLIYGSQHSQDPKNTKNRNSEKRWKVTRHRATTTRLKQVKRQKNRSDK